MPYGANRTSVASDTFDSAISGDWENGGGSWGAMQTVSGGHISPAAVNSDSAIRRNNETFDADQWSRVTIQAQSAVTQIAASCRMQAGTDESSYQGYADDVGNEWEITETTSALGFIVLATSSTDYATGSPGDTVTLEAEGTTLRLGSDIPGTDAERLSATDATLASGEPGAHIYIQSGAATDGQITAWEAGNISAAVDPSAYIPNVINIYNRVY